MKKYTTITVSAVIVILLAIISYQVVRGNRLEDQNQLQSVIIASQNDSIVAYKSKNGDLTYKLNSVTVEHDNAKKALELANFDIKEFKSRDIRWRDINMALQAKINAQGNGNANLIDTVIISKTDTIYRSNFSWSNRYLSLRGFVLNKNLQFSYKYATDLSLISEKKGKNYVISAYLSDPSAVVTSGNSITIVPTSRFYKKNWFWLTIGVIGGYFIPK